MNIKVGPKKGEFYTLLPDIRSNWKTSGVVFENEKELLTPPRRILRPVEGGIPPLRQTPRLGYDPKKERCPAILKASIAATGLSRSA